MRVEDLCFPILFFTDWEKKPFIEVVRTYEDLTTTTSYGVRKNVHCGAIIMDGYGNAARIKGATILKGVGRFSGFTIFFSRNVKVDLLIDEVSFFHISLDELKEKVQACFNGWEGWEEAGNFEEMQAAIMEAYSIEDVIKYIDKIGNRE